VDGLSGRILDRQRGARRFGYVEAPRGFAVGQRCGLAVDRNRCTHKCERGRRLRGLLDRDERGELIVLLHLLLDLRELDELGGELVGVERVKRILVLELGRQQGEEGREVARDRGFVDRAVGRGGTAGGRRRSGRRAGRSRRRGCGRDLRGDGRK